MINEENRVSCVVFDWAGTTVDFGCEAPVGAFMKAFGQEGLPVSEAEARGPMGLPKRDHVRELLKLERVSALFAEKLRTCVDGRRRRQNIRRLCPGAHGRPQRLLRADPRRR